MKNSRPTQVQRVLKYIDDFGSITTYEALMDIGVMSLSSRICEIQKKGIRIYKRDEETRNRYGEKCYITRYAVKPFE